MNKKLLVVLVAGLLLVSAVSCGRNKKPSGDNKDTFPGNLDTLNPSESYIVIEGTDASGNVVTSIEPVTTAPEVDVFDPSEQNPTFTAVEKKIVVITAVATIRDQTVVNDSTGVSWPKEGTILDATGESTNWYRISRDGKELYIAKSTVADAAALEGFTKVENETITISTGNAGGAVNVRSYPSSESDKTIRGSLKEGATATRVAVGEKWSRILFEVEETDKDGNKVKVTKEYYISNDCIKTDDGTAAGTDAATDAPTDTAADTQ